MLRAKFVILIIVPIVAFGGSAAADIVRFREAGERSQNGTITDVSQTSVKLLRTTGNEAEFPAYKVAATQFEQEPPGLTAVRAAVQGSRFPEAWETLGKIDPNTIANPFARQDYEFYQAFLAAKLAQNDRDKMGKAIRLMSEFLRKNPKSYHYFEACEMLGEMQQSLGDPEQAKEAFRRLALAPWPFYSLKANLALGSIELDNGRIADAKKLFATVIQSQDGDAESLRGQAEARIGLARCLIRENEPTTAIRDLEELAEKTDPEDASLQAAICNTLGEAWERSNDPKEAILAYLQVDILYFSAKSERIRALKRLAVLWREVQRPDRAAEVEATLKEVGSEK